MPRLADHRLELEALDQHAALVVHREVHRADHPVAPALAQPAGGRVEQRPHHLDVVLQLEEAEHAPGVPLVLVEGAVDLGADAAHHAPVAPGQEELRLAVLEERPRAPARGTAVRSILSGGIHCSALECSRNGSSMKSRTSLREETGATSTDTARDCICLRLSTYSRRHAATSGSSSSRLLATTTSCPTSGCSRARPGPWSTMEGHERIMLGSNNYLGLTGDPRVKEAARDALERFGTGLTGSRFLNGTLSLHLELERKLAEFMGTEDALVFTTGYLANTGAIGTLLGPGDTVICDSGDHASILDAVSMSRARIRPYRHNRLDKLETMLQRSESDGGGVLVVVDGVFSMEGDLAPVPDIVDALPRARRAPDDRRGPRRGRAGRARRRRLRADGRGGRGGPAHGHVLEVARLLRRLHRRARRRDRLPARPVALVHVHGRRGARGDRRGARRARDHPLGRGPAADGSGCSTTRATCTTAWRTSATT